jgi:hypothetical protein
MKVKIIDWYNRLTARRTIINNQQDRIDGYKKVIDAQAATIKEIQDKLDKLRLGVNEFVGKIDNW